MNRKKVCLLLLVVVLALCIGCSVKEENEKSSAGTEATQTSPAETVNGAGETSVAENPSLPAAGEVTYILKFVNQKGWAIEGVVAKVCNADACVMAVSDERGLCELTLPASTYEVQLLNIPEGYETTGNTTYTTPVGGGELVVTLKQQ